MIDQQISKGLTQEDDDSHQFNIFLNDHSHSLHDDNKNSNPYLNSQNINEEGNQDSNQYANNRMASVLFDDEYSDEDEKLFDQLNQENAVAKI